MDVQAPAIAAIANIAAIVAVTMTATGGKIVAMVNAANIAVTIHAKKNAVILMTAMGVKIVFTDTVKMTMMSVMVNAVTVISVIVKIMTAGVMDQVVITAMAASAHVPGYIILEV